MSIILSATYSSANALAANERAVSLLKIYEKSEDFSGFEFLNCKLVKNNLINIQNTTEGEYSSGSLISKAEEASFPVTELIPSWNVNLPSSTGMVVYFQISDDGKTWSDWFFIGKDGDTPNKINKIYKNDTANVDTDFLNISKPQRFFKWKIDFYTKSAFKNPRLKLFAVSIGNNGMDKENENGTEKFRFDKNSVPDKEKWAKKLNVPYRSQLAESKDIANSVCCPTSISMVLEYLGKNYPTRDICNITFDPEYQIWGSWWRASQTISTFGFRSYVVQIRDFDEIKNYIAKGVPLIFSLKAVNGELPSSPYKETGGHVAVIIGLDEDENVWINDPYNTDGVIGPRKWTKKEVTDVFIKKGGVVVIADIESNKDKISIFGNAAN